MPNSDLSAELYLYLTTKGHKSGQSHEIEIWFVAHEGRYYLVSEKREHSHWVQNIRTHPMIAFRVGDQHFSGTGRIVDADAEYDLVRTVSALMDAKYEWSDGLIVELSPDLS